MYRQRAPLSVKQNGGFYCRDEEALQGANTDDDRVSGEANLGAEASPSRSFLCGINSEVDSRSIFDNPGNAHLASYVIVGFQRGPGALRHSDK